MRNDNPKILNISPGNFGVLIFYLLLQLGCCFSNNLEISQHGISLHTAFHEYGKISSPGILLHMLNGL